MLFRGIGFALAPGECLVIEGTNGSGKTSLLRIIAGLVDPDDGEILWRGRSIRDHRQDYCRHLVWYGHASGCKQDLTLLENLRCEQALRPGKSNLDEVLERLGLSKLTGLPLRVLSAGQQRRVALARLYLPDPPPLWILDEPFTALDTQGTAQLERHLAAHCVLGGTVVLTTHHELVRRPPACHDLDLGQYAA